MSSDAPQKVDEKLNAPGLQNFSDGFRDRAPRRKSAIKAVGVIKKSAQGINASDDESAESEPNSNRREKEKEEEECSKCGHFIRSADMNLHMLSHPQVTFKCRHCEFTSPTSRGVAMHLRRSHGIHGKDIADHYQSLGDSEVDDPQNSSKTSGSAAASKVDDSRSLFTINSTFRTKLLDILKKSKHWRGWNDKNKCTMCPVHIPAGLMVDHIRQHASRSCLKCSLCENEQNLEHDMRLHLDETHSGEGEFVDLTDDSLYNELTSLLALCFPMFSDVVNDSGDINYDKLELSGAPQQAPIVRKRGRPRKRRAEEVTDHVPSECESVPHESPRPESASEDLGEVTMMQPASEIPVLTESSSPDSGISGCATRATRSPLPRPENEDERVASDIRRNEYDMGDIDMTSAIRIGMDEFNGIPSFDDIAGNFPPDTPAPVQSEPQLQTNVLNNLVSSVLPTITPSGLDLIQTLAPGGLEAQVKFIEAVQLALSFAKQQIQTQQFANVSSNAAPPPAFPSTSSQGTMPYSPSDSNGPTIPPSIDVCVGEINQSKIIRRRVMHEPEAGGSARCTICNTKVWRVRIDSCSIIAHVKLHATRPNHSCSKCGNIGYAVADIDEHIKSCHNRVGTVIDTRNDALVFEWLLLAVHCFPSCFDVLKNSFLFRDMIGYVRALTPEEVERASVRYEKVISTLTNLTLVKPSNEGDLLWAPIVKQCRTDPVPLNKRQYNAPVVTAPMTGPLSYSQMEPVAYPPIRRTKTVNTVERTTGSGRTKRFGYHNCKKCGDIAMSDNEAFIHLRKHSLLSTFMCSICKFGGETKEEISEHMIAVHDKLADIRDLSGAVEAEKLSLQMECFPELRNCIKKFIPGAQTKQLPQSEFKVITSSIPVSNGKVECKKCSALVTIETQRVMTHIMSHASRQRYKCNLCGLDGPSCVFIQEHLHKSHPNSLGGAVIDIICEELRAEWYHLQSACFPTITSEFFNPASSKV